MLVSTLINIAWVLGGLFCMLMDNLSGAYCLFSFAVGYSCAVAIFLWSEKHVQNETPVIGYICDEKQGCNRYCKDKDDRYCHHTLDVKHAANFEEIEPGMFVEKVEREKED